MIFPVAGQGGLGWEEKVVLALIFEGGEEEWKSGIRKPAPEVPHVFRVKKFWTRKKVCFRDACTAFRVAASSCKSIQSDGAPENHLEKQELLDEHELWREGLAAVVQSENTHVFHALFGHDTVFHTGKPLSADTPPRLSVQQQRAAQSRLEFCNDKLLQKIIDHVLEPEWREWQNSMREASQTFKFNERIDLSIDPEWPVNTCDLGWVNNRIRDPKKDGRREWWRNFHNESLLIRFKTARLTRLARILKALMQNKNQHSSAIEQYPSLYDQDGMRESVAWLKKVSTDSDPPSDRDLLGRPECVQRVCKNLSDLKKLFCLFVSVSEVRNPDNLYAKINSEEEAILINKRITANGLHIVGNTIAISSDQAQQHLEDPLLYTNIVQQANLAEYRASGIRPGPAGIEFSNAFIEVCVHANARRVLRFPLNPEFNMEDYVFQGDAEIQFWEEMKKVFKDSGLQEAAHRVCDGKVSDKWDMRNMQFWTEVWSRRGSLDVKMFVPCRALHDKSSELGKRPQVEGIFEQVAAACIAHNHCSSAATGFTLIQILFLQGKVHGLGRTSSWQERLRSGQQSKSETWIPIGLPNIGNSCYQNSILQVGSGHTF
jgi:hypothetical protein